MTVGPCGTFSGATRFLRRGGPLTRDTRRVPLDDDLVWRLRELLHEEEDLVERRMFGGLAFLVEGNMAVAASREGGLLLRVDPLEAPKLLERAHVHPRVMAGRPAHGWIRVAAEGLRTRQQLERWVRIGVARARGLPPRRGSRRPDRS